METQVSDAQSKGGRARAAILSPSDRSRIASMAASARWNASVVCAAYEGPLRVGEIELDAAVLEDGARVLTSRAFLTALGRPWKGTYKHTSRPNFVDAKNLDPFVPEEMQILLAPVEYRSLRGQKVLGYLAELLPRVCEVYLAAQAASKLTRQQEQIAVQAAILDRALRDIGIIGLVDEATGYQRVRARDELQVILARYIAEELLPWAKRFPDSFYEQLHRVWGWPYKPGNYKRNAYIGRLTNQLIYEQLPPGVLSELRSRNPRDPATGRRRRTHHEHLTDDVGHPNLQSQIQAVTTLLRATPSGQPDFFKVLFRNAFPGQQPDLFDDQLSAITRV